MGLDEMDILLYDIRRLKTFLKMLDKQSAITALSRIGGTPLEATDSEDGNLIFIKMVDSDLTKIVNWLRSQKRLVQEQNAVPYTFNPPCDFKREKDAFELKLTIISMIATFIWGVIVGGFIWRIGR